MLNKTIKDGILALTADGVTIKFASTTTLNQDNPKEVKMLLDMQGEGNLKYKTNNQQPSTADFTLQNVKIDEFRLIEKLFKNNATAQEISFSLSFVGYDGTSINYVEPSIKKQPMQANIDESDNSFNIMLNIECKEIVYA